MRLRIPRRIKTETPVEEDSEASDSAVDQDKDKVPVSTKSSTVSRILVEINCGNKKHPRSSQNIFQG